MDNIIKLKLDNLLNKAIKKIEITEKQEKHDRWLKKQEKEKRKIATEREINSKIAEKFNNYVWVELLKVSYITHYQCTSCGSNTFLLNGCYSIEETKNKDNEIIHRALRIEYTDNAKAYYSSISIDTCAGCVIKTEVNYDERYHQILEDLFE